MNLLYSSRSSQVMGCTGICCCPRNHPSTLTAPTPTTPSKGTRDPRCPGLACTPPETTAVATTGSPRLHPRPSSDFRYRSSTFCQSNDRWVLQQVGPICRVPPPLLSWRGVSVGVVVLVSPIPPISFQWVARVDGGISGFWLIVPDYGRGENRGSMRFDWSFWSFYGGGSDTGWHRGFWWTGTWI
jgi:hypothetical protein